MDRDEGDENSSRACTSAMGWTGIQTNVKRISSRTVTSVSPRTIRGGLRMGRDAKRVKASRGSAGTRGPAAKNLRGVLRRAVLVQVLVRVREQLLVAASAQ
jgi:hypothetical protein